MMRYSVQPRDEYLEKVMGFCIFLKNMVKTLLKK